MSQKQPLRHSYPGRRERYQPVGWADTRPQRNKTIPRMSQRPKRSTKDRRR
jgi:hypothetical protein